MTVAVKNKPPVVVPPAALRRAGFTSGQELEVKASDGIITILPKLPVDDEYTPAERRAIDRGIAASEKDYEEGRSYGPFKTHEALVASLHAESAKLRKRKNNRAAK
jgi:antitoxin component of MazEF toxin-antitoxin module